MFFIFSFSTTLLNILKTSSSPFPNIQLYYPQKNKEYAIISSCFTGIGTAIKSNPFTFGLAVPTIAITSYI